MTTYLETDLVLAAHRRLMDLTGGSQGVRDPEALEASVHQPEQTMLGRDVYPTLAEKAAALAFALLTRKPFVDGNARLGWAMLRSFLLLNGFEVRGSTDEKEQVVLAVADGEMSREELSEWLRRRLTPRIA